MVVPSNATEDPSACQTSLIDVFEVVIEVLISVPSFAIYIFLFNSYLNKRPRILNDSFFTLYLLSAGLSMALFTMSTIFARIPGIGLFCAQIYSFTSQPTRLLSFPYFLTYYLAYAMLFSNVVISVNRMCSVLIVTDFSKMWERLTPICVFLVLVLPLPLSAHLLFVGVSYMKIDHSLGMVYEKKDTTWPANSLISLIANLTCALIVTATTLVTAFGMSRMIRRHKKSEVSLLQVGALQSLGTLLVASYALYIVLETKNSADNWLYDFLYHQKFIITDYQCFCSAWTLLLLSANVRKEILQSFVKRTDAVKTSLGKGGFSKVSTEV